MRKAGSMLGLAAAAALVLGACGGDDAGDKVAEKIIEDASGGSVDINSDDGSVSVQGSDGQGSFSIGSGDVPDALKDFPLPDDYKVTASFSGSGETGSGATVNLAVNGDVKDIADGMKSGLEDNDYAVTGEYSAEANGTASETFSFEGNGQSGSVTVIEDDSTEGFNASLTIFLSTA